MIWCWIAICLPRALLTDRRYDANHSRGTLDRRDALPVVPMRKSRKRRVGVERMLKRLKNVRTVATRYDKTVGMVLGFIGTTFIRLWHRYLSTWLWVRTPKT